jgi:hypothetical protein
MAYGRVNKKDEEVKKEMVEIAIAKKGPTTTSQARDSNRNKD